MADCDFLEKAIEYVKQARDEDEKDNYQEAYRLYLLSLEYFMTALKYEKNEKRKATIRMKTGEYMVRAEQIKSFLNNSPDHSNNNKLTENSNANSDQKHTPNLDNVIIRESPNVSWDDVAGLFSAKEALKEAVILPIKFPNLFVGQRKPWSGILLYGPPGTGKSYLAKAVATESNATFFSVSSSDLLSKWLGESEKLVRQLFVQGRDSNPSIIFIDEIDSLCSMRGEAESESARRIKTEFLIQMNGVGKNMQGILVLAATNMPWMLDPAIRRRFEKRIYIGLPDEGARTKILQLHLADTSISFDKQCLHDIAKQTEGYSGSDIATLVHEVLMYPIRMIQNATHFRRSQAPDHHNPQLLKWYWEPCSPGDPQATPMTWMDVKSDELLEPPVSLSHFYKALNTVRPTVNSKDLIQQVQFTTEFGQDG